MNTKKLSQLEVLESAEGTHVLVEQDGKHKRVPAAMIGGGGAGIDVTATVGQTIVVTEVDANGKPTKWKAADYQEKICGTGLVELLNTTLYAETENMVDLTIKEGETYYVTFNGVEYTCVGTLAERDGQKLCYIGNGAVAGLDDSGEPFAVGYIPAGGVTVAIIWDETIEQADIVVRGTGYIPIPVQYVTNALPYYIEVIGSGTDDDPYVCNDTVANVEEVYKSGRPVGVKLTTYAFAGGEEPKPIGYVEMFLSLGIAMTSLNGTASSGYSPYGMVLAFSAATYTASGTAAGLTLTLTPQEDGTYLVSKGIGS